MTGYGRHRPCPARRSQRAGQGSQAGFNGGQTISGAGAVAFQPGQGGAGGSAGQKGARDEVFIGSGLTGVNPALIGEDKVHLAPVQRFAGQAPIERLWRGPAGYDQAGPAPCIQSGFKRRHDLRGQRVDRALPRFKAVKLLRHARHQTIRALLDGSAERLVTGRRFRPGRGARGRRRRSRPGSTRRSSARPPPPRRGA